MTRYLAIVAVLLLGCGRFVRAKPGIANSAVSGGAAALATNRSRCPPLQRNSECPVHRDRSTIADTVPRPAGSPIPPPAPEMTTRIFCQQPVTVRIADRASVPERYRGFLGMWSDAAWTAQLCAALVVENIASDGTATIHYAFGPIGSNARVPGGVLNGTGIVQDGELRFQNSDGSQFAFRPLYADLDGRLTTPQGQSYQAIFKKTP